jgi:hypothetical protein
VVLVSPSDAARRFRSFFRIFVLATLIASWFAAVGRAHADVRMSVVDTDPAGERISLGRDEPFYVRIEYVADEAVSIWARPYFNGKEVLRAKTNASVPHSGTGYALGWFSLDEVSAVDEVRIKAGGGKPYREWDVASHRVNVIGTGLPAGVHTKASWVDEMLMHERAVQRDAYEKRMSEPVSAGDHIFMSGFMLAVLVLLLCGLAAPIWGLWKWHGRWRVAAAAPGVLMAFIVLRILIGTAIDPTSHNLWPFEILMVGAVSLAIMLVLTIARRFVRSQD